MVQNWQEINKKITQHFWWFFGFVHSIYKKMQEKVARNVDKNGPGEYLTMNSRHFLLSCNPFWWISNFLDTIGPSRSVCIGWSCFWRSLTIYISSLFQLSQLLFILNFDNFAVLCPHWRNFLAQCNYFVAGQGQNHPSFPMRWFGQKIVLTSTLE